ncbi:MAG: sodium-translocating pyrophosphatase [Candidatus Riflebacteria bacterium]|nr:sodium-translocating pyrophosphatase [Candidatus Riflebacteria bacterium]
MALVYSYYFYASMKKSDPGSEKSQEIAGYVKEGAKSYLLAQYKIVGLFFIIAFAFFSFLAFVLEVQSPWTPIAFLTGGFFSALSGYLGMKAATSASNRTAAAANISLNSALQIAFRSGAVMGFVVVGLGLLDISIWWKILNYVLDNKEFFKESIFAVNNYTEITTIMLTFGMGASSQALFARVGGGIFTKAADIGADLVGKTEAGIPEDDPRNPACIADNVGDNVGDVAGMGADLYESYCGSILATAALGAAAFNTTELINLQLNSILLPMAIAGIGIVFSIFGTYKINTKEEANQKELMESINYGVNFAAFFTAVTSVALVRSLLPGHFEIFGSIVTGLMAGIIIGWATNYYTSEDYQPTANIAEQATTGSATVIIEGISTGMLSTAIPVITVCIAILLSYGFANGFTNPAMGLYGIGIAAVGMLSTLGITLATDAYGPIADNAGGNAQMSGMSPEVRKRTDALDSLGNTTAATGKGFAIGSAALTALALIGAYLEEIRMALLRIAKFSGDPLNKLIFPSPNEGIEIEKATLYDFMSYYNVNLMNPVVLTGIFIGSMLVFVFCAMTMKAVGKAAHSMVEEVRRQFKEIPGLLKGEPNAKADYASCVAISTQGAQKEMVVPSLLAIIVPIIVGLLLGVAGVIGMLAGGLSTGFVLAIMMSNAGGAWDNAKKYIESGQFGGKGSENHKAAVVGDTVGDPFKDTAGPSLNILIKLMSMVAVVIAGLTVNYSPKIQEIIGLNPKELSNRKAYAIVRGVQDTEDLYESKQNSSSIFEDPLLGTEDIILPTDEDMLRIKTSSTDADKGSKPAAQTTTAPATSKPVKPAATSGFDSDFGGGFDTLATDKKEETKPATSGGFDSGFGGGFDSFDSTPATDKKEETKSDTSGGFDSGFGGGFDSFDSTPATDKKEETKSDTSGGFDSGFGGGFDSFDTPAATEKKEDAKPATSGGFDAGFDSFDSTPAPAEKKEETKPAASGGFDTFDTPAPAEKKEEPKQETSSGFEGGFDSFDAPAATEKKEEAKPAEPAKVEETPKAEEPAPAEPAKVEEAPKAEEAAPAEPAKVEETPKAEETAPAEPAKVEEAAPTEPAKVEEAPKAEETAPAPAKVEEAPKAEESTPAEPAKDDNTAATKENSNNAEKNLEEIKTNISEKIENSLDKATEAIKEKVENKVEEKKDAFSGGFDNF